MQHETGDVAAISSESGDAGELDTQDQPGGTIGLRNGVPINPLSIAEAARSSLDVIGENWPWLAPLIESAAAFPPGNKAKIITEWGNGTDNSDPEKYEAYCAFIRKEIEAHVSWLWPLLDACGALVLITPGSFSFATHLHIGLSFSIPNLAQFTYLTPFALESEAVRH